MFIQVICGLIIAATVYTIINLFMAKSSFNVVGRTVIVTGGSQGLGLALAQGLAAKGAHIVIVAQTVSKLEKALVEIRSSAANPEKQRFLFLSYDLRDPKSAPAILHEVTRWNNGEPPDVVLNCAGYCVPGFFATTSTEVMRDQMDTLYWSCAQMAHATLQEWLIPTDKESRRSYDDRPRHLIFVSSIVAFLPLAGYAPYTPAKSAMRALADTLNQEVQVYNGSRKHPKEDAPAAEIKVHAVFPLGILSPGFENEQKTKPALTQKLEEDDTPQKAEELAATIISELEAGRYIITASLIGQIMKGWAMAGSQRVGVMDYLYSWLGSLIVLFIVPDFLSKCWKWGKDKGFSAAR